MIATQSPGLDLTATTLTMSSWIVYSTSFLKRTRTWPLVASRNSWWDRLKCCVLERRKLHLPTLLKFAKRCTGKESHVTDQEELLIQLYFRQPKHLLDFLLAELGTSGSVDGNSQLIIKGRFQPKQIENVLRRYEFMNQSSGRILDSFLFQIHQRVRHLPHMPLAGNNLAKRHAYLLPAVRVVRLEMFGSKYQKWFPSRHQQTCSNASKDCLRHRATTPTFCICGSFWRRLERLFALQDLLLPSLCIELSNFVSVPNLEWNKPFELTSGNCKCFLSELLRVVIREEFKI